MKLSYKDSVILYPFSKAESICHFAYFEHCINWFILMLWILYWWIQIKCVLSQLKKIKLLRMKWRLKIQCVSFNELEKQNIRWDWPHYITSKKPWGLNETLNHTLWNTLASFANLTMHKSQFAQDSTRLPVVPTLYPH